MMGNIMGSLRSILTQYVELIPTIPSEYIMQHDNDATEFFVKALYHWLVDEEALADYNVELALTSLRVNDMYQREILGKMN